jgi:hypothetical protein
MQIGWSLSVPQITLSLLQHYIPQPSWAKIIQLLTKDTMAESFPILKRFAGTTFVLTYITPFLAALFATPIPQFHSVSCKVGYVIGINSGANKLFVANMEGKMPCVVEWWPHLISAYQGTRWG